MFKNNTWYWKSEDSTDVFARNNSNLELITGWSTSSLQHMAPGCRYIDPQTPSVFLVITDNKGLCSTIISNPSKESMVQLMIIIWKAQCPEHCLGVSISCKKLIIRLCFYYYLPSSSSLLLFCCLVCFMQHLLIDFYQHSHSANPY